MTDAATRPPFSPSDATLDRLAQRSFDLILELQDSSGAYPASPTFSAYAGYSWFRDGAFIADAVSAHGGVGSADRFFDWCARVLDARAAEIAGIVDAARSGSPVADSRMLATRFTFAGEEGNDDWWDFQLDGYGTWLWALAEHAGRHGLDLERWRGAVELTIDYLLVSWQRPCFDWWEESSDRVHVSTLGCIAAGLRSIAATGLLSAERSAASASAAEAIVDRILHEGVVDGHLAKWLGSTEVDASLLAVISPLAVVDAGSELGRRTIDEVDRQLAVDGGVHRYRADTFYGGGQWPLLSCFLGLARAAEGDRETALALLSWAAGTADDAGTLPEQVGRHLLDPGRVDEWVDRWGPVARPLLWSHAMFLRLADELGVAAPLERESAR
jgi:GH15 family glucan-1,4-alpha-glucosidase